MTAQQGALAWERQPNEPARSHAAFRTFRDQAPAHRNIVEVAIAAGVTDRAVRKWADRWEWWERAEAWDDECYRVEDAERLDAIRTMHATHRRAGRAMLLKALAALNAADAEHIPVNIAARLLDLGAKLERQTLIVSVRELQGFEDDVTDDDPWDAIATELASPS